MNINVAELALTLPVHIRFPPIVISAAPKDNVEDPVEIIDNVPATLVSKPPKSKFCAKLGVFQVKFPKLEFIR